MAHRRKGERATRGGTPIRRRSESKTSCLIPRLSKSFVRSTTPFPETISHLEQYMECAKSGAHRSSTSLVVADLVARMRCAVRCSRRRTHVTSFRGAQRREATLARLATWNVGEWLRCENPSRAYSRRARACVRAKCEIRSLGSYLRFSGGVLTYEFLEAFIPHPTGGFIHMGWVGHKCNEMTLD